MAFSIDSLKLLDALSSSAVFLFPSGDMRTLVNILQFSP